MLYLKPPRNCDCCRLAGGGGVWGVIRAVAGCLSSGLNRSVGRLRGASVRPSERRASRTADIRTVAAERRLSGFETPWVLRGLAPFLPASLLMEILPQGAAGWETPPWWCCGWVMSELGADLSRPRAPGLDSAWGGRARRHPQAGASGSSRNGFLCRLQSA